MLKGKAAAQSTQAPLPAPPTDQSLTDQSLPATGQFPVPDSLPATGQSSAPKLEKLVTDYLKCKKDFHKLQQKITELETHLNAAFDQQQIDQLSTVLGVFKRIKIEGRVKWIIEM